MIAKSPLASVFAALFAIVILSGCESVDSLNPVDWFDDEEEASTEPRPVPGADGPFPAIGAVPDRPPTPQIARDLDEIEEGLIADKANAKYTDQVIRQRSEPTRDGGASGVSASSTAPPPAEPPSDPPTASIAAGQAPQPARPPASIFSAPQSTAPQATAPQAAAPRAAAPQPARPQPATPQGATPQPQRQAAAPQPARPQPATPQPATPQPATPQPATPQAATPQAAAPQAATPQPAPAPQPVRAAPPPQRAGAAPPSAADLAAAPASPSIASAAPQSASPTTPQPGQVLHLATLYFPNGGASLTAQDRAVLQQVMALYNNGGKQMRVVGHASSGAASSDPARQDLANYKASLDRATAAAGALLELGMPQPAIQIAAVGARQPRFAETTPEGVAGNQRVEIFVRY